MARKSEYVRLTQTDLPQVPPGRIKGSQRGNVEHYWAANKRESGGHGSSLFYERGTIYSYGRHFPIARHILVKKTKAAIILFTTRSYSSFTAKHKRYVESAIPSTERNRVYYVFDPEADTRGQHIDNLNKIGAEALALVEKSKKARQRKTEYLSRAASLTEKGNRYAAIVGLKERLGSPTGGDLASWAAKVQEEAAIAQKRSEAAQKAKHTKAIRKWELELVEWQNGGEKNPGSCPSWADERRLLTYVRVSRKKFLQTTLGMTVPLKEVMPVLEHIRGYDPAEVDTESRGFAIQDWEGTVFWMDRVFVIGCHRIQFAEIERAAKAAGL